MIYLNKYETEKLKGSNPNIIKKFHVRCIFFADIRIFFIKIKSSLIFKKKLPRDDQIIFTSFLFFSRNLITIRASK